MQAVYYIATDITSPLGFSSGENAQALFANQGKIKKQNNNYYLPGDFCASLVDNKKLEAAFSTIKNGKVFTRFEKMVLCSVSNALAKTEIDITSEDTLLIISSTKGNIHLLEESKKRLYEPSRVNLWRSAEVIQKFFKSPNKPLVISHACISGIAAQIVARRLIEAKQYKNIVVVGADMATPFVASGFQSFMALSPNPCRPFDKTRNGISLGEGAATVILSPDKNLAKTKNTYTLEPGSITNDANHISGPSRTGEGLYLAIKKVMKNNTGEVDFINAHGTGTIYNDEMESFAFARSNLLHVPVNSFKGYIGHTLGAAGVTETVFCILSMEHGILVKSLGYENCGVSHPLNIIEKNIPAKINTCLKVASGFGGCNAAIIIKKHS